MNSMSNHTFHRGLFVEAESKSAARRPTPARLAAIVGVLLAANLVFVVSAVSSETPQRDIGSFAPTVLGIDNQFDPLELDLNATPRGTVVALVDIPFDPLLP